MTNDSTSLTQPVAATAARPGRPQPATDAERYLFALLDSQAALDAALAALTARMALADTDETDDIRLSKDEIQLEYFKLESRKTAFLTRGVSFKTFTDLEVQRIRNILGQLQGFTARKENAAAIVDAVNKLLLNWKKVPPPADLADPIASLADTID